MFSSYISKLLFIITISLSLISISFASTKWKSPEAKELHLIEDFPLNLTGSPDEINPGNLKMYLYVPADMPENAPVVFALHGCLQNAHKFSQQSGWTKLADLNKFYVVFPQQQAARISQPIKTGNPGLCFDWAGFFGNQKPKGEGEDKSIIDMINHLEKLDSYSIDKKSVFITGVSAGANLAVKMLAQWPEYFAGGAPIAGVPYGCANNQSEGFRCMGVKPSFFPRKGKQGECTESGEACMDPELKKTAQEWGDIVRNEHESEKNIEYPKIMIWHGSRDQLVDDDNQEQLLLQWTNLHNIDQIADNKDSKLKDGHERHTYKEYHDDNGNIKVATVLINGLRHGIAIEPGDKDNQGGEESTNSLRGGYSFDYMIHSTYYIAKFWGLISKEK